MPRSLAIHEHVTATGWRVVGRAAELLGEPARDDAVHPGAPGDLLFGARFQLRPRLGSGSALTPALAALGAGVAETWDDAPPLLPDAPLYRAASRFQGLRWDPSGDADAWRGDLLWRHRHPVLAGVPCTTHVQLVQLHGHVGMTVRVHADGGIGAVRGMVGAGQARPRFLSAMNRTLRLRFGGADGDAHPLADHDVDDFVRDVLLAESRDYPVAILAPLEDGEYVLSPDVAADELAGLAHLYVLERHQATFRLTDALGDRRLSAYWGALRVYLPEFSCADRPEDHPLLVRDRLIDPTVRAELVGRLAQRVASLVEPVPAAAAQPAATPERSNAASHREGTSAAPLTSSHVALSPDVAQALASLGTLPGVLSGLEGALASMTNTIARLVQANAVLSDEVDRLRTTSAVRAANTVSLERRIRSLESLIREHVADVAVSVPGDEADAADTSADADADGDGDGDDDAATLVEALRQAALAHPDQLLVLDGAERAALRSPYEDVDRLSAVFDAMASVARRRQAGALGAPLRVAFRELGIEYRGGISASTSARHQEQYQVAGPDGRTYTCEEHIVLGTSYDPRHCLRIYFTSRAALEPRFVIGHVGRHFDVATTT